MQSNLISTEASLRFQGFQLELELESEAATEKQAFPGVVTEDPPDTLAGILPLVTG